MWFASVTVGRPAIAPCPNAVPISMRRATFGASPRAAMSYSTLGLRAVEQEADDMTRRPLGRIEHVVAHDAVLAARIASTVAVERRAAEQRRDGGRDVDEPAAARGTSPRLRDAPARDHERRPGLHDAERAVLADVAALVLPVVRGGVQHAQVGRGGRVEELDDLLEGVRVGVVGAVRVQVGELGVERREGVGRLVGERVARPPPRARSRRLASRRKRTRPSALRAS